MKIRFLLLIILVISFIFIFSQSIVKSQQVVYKNDDGNYILSKGKNLVYFSDNIEVKELVLKYPEIESVSYFDYDKNQTIGYVNIYGGIGEEFRLKYGEFYEISLKLPKNISLN